MGISLIAGKNAAIEFLITGNDVTTANLNATVLLRGSFKCYQDSLGSASSPGAINGLTSDKSLSLVLCSVSAVTGGAGNSSVNIMVSGTGTRIINWSCSAMTTIAWSVVYFFDIVIKCQLLNYSFLIYFLP